MSSSSWTSDNYLNVGAKLLNLTKFKTIIMLSQTTCTPQVVHMHFLWYAVVLILGSMRVFQSFWKAA